jgi:hypothetical protein
MRERKDVSGFTLHKSELEPVGSKNGDASGLAIHTVPKDQPIAHSHILKAMVSTRYVLESEWT